jgi:hypothetical protein
VTLKYNESYKSKFVFLLSCNCDIHFTVAFHGNEETANSFWESREYYYSSKEGDLKFDEHSLYSVTTDFRIAMQFSRLGKTATFSESWFRGRGNLFHLQALKVPSPDLFSKQAISTVRRNARAWQRLQGAYEFEDANAEPELDLALKQKNDALALDLQKINKAWREAATQIDEEKLLTLQPTSYVNVSVEEWDLMKDILDDEIQELLCDDDMQFSFDDIN